MDDMDREQYWTRPPRRTGVGAFGTTAMWLAYQAEKLQREGQRMLWEGEFSDVAAAPVVPAMDNGEGEVA